MGKCCCFFEIEYTVREKVRAIQIESNTVLIEMSAFQLQCCKGENAGETNQF